MNLAARLTIRPIQSQEQDEARALILSGLEERWGVIDPTKNPDLTDLMANYGRGVFLVALLDGAIVGTGALLPEGEATGRIVRMSVKKALRSQGLGTAILDELIRAARALGMDRIVLETTANWLDAVAFYEKRGFCSLGVRDGDHHFEMVFQVASIAYKDPDRAFLTEEIMSLNERLARLLAEKSRQDRFSGAVLVSREGQPLFSQAYGYANRSWGVANRIDGRFRIASISKMFTAVAILQLVAEGQLKLDDSVVGILDLQQTTIPVEASVYHMLTMTSGIADWFDESGDWEAEWTALCRQHPIYLFRGNADYLPLFIHEAPLAPVGQEHRYNGAGYILLGLILERLTGQSYFEAIRQRIFAKAGMSRSDFVALDEVQAEVAEGYIPIKDGNDQILGWKRNIYSTTPEAAADGGAISTTADLASFSLALRKGHLLSDSMTQAMLTPKVWARAEPLKGYLWKYGYGNYFLLDKQEQIIRWGHTGEEDGASCRLYYYPAQNLDVIILANQSWAAGELAWEVHDLILEAGP